MTKRLKHRKRYTPHCPAFDCQGGFASRLTEISAEKLNLPPEIQARVKMSDRFYRCGYCGFVWAQNIAKEIGFDATPLGHIRNFSNINNFEAVEGEYQIREENRPDYYLR